MSREFEAERSAISMWQACADDKSKMLRKKYKFQNCVELYYHFGITIKNTVKLVPTCTVLDWFE